MLFHFDLILFCIHMALLYVKCKCFQLLLNVIVFQTLASVCGKFAPFEIKEHMTLAPLTRVHCEEAVLEELDRYLTEPDDSFDCLKDWISRKPRNSGPTKPKYTDTLRFVY